MALGLADGQLAAAAATILGVGTAERCVTLTLHNTTAADQTVILRLTRSGSTARTIFYGVVKQYETYIVTGILMDPSDVLSGYATSASAVDYLVNLSPFGPFAVQAIDATGVQKASSDLTVTLPSDNSLTAGEVEIVGLLKDIRTSLWKIQ